MFSYAPSLQKRNISFLAYSAQICFATILILIFAAASNASSEAQSIGKLRKQAEKAMRQGDFETAVGLWQQVLKREPENIDYRLALGYALFKHRKLVESHNEVLPVAEANKENALSRAILGQVYLAAGRLDVAKELLGYALYLNPEEPLALAGSAMLDFYENRSKEGLRKLRLASYLEPDEPDFLFSYAQVAARTEQYKEAASAYEKFLKIAPITDVDRRTRIQGLISFLRYLGGIKSLYNTGGKNETVVDCEIVNNRPVIKVHLNGREQPLRFVLDTGSGMTVISEETAQKLGIKAVVRGGMARAVGGGGKFEIVYGFVNSMEIGDVRVSNVPVYIRKFNGTGDKFDGYIGLSVIAKYLTTLDYGAKTFALVKNVDKKDEKKSKNIQTVAFAKDDKLSVPLRTTSSGFLSSEVKVEGVKEPLNFIVDTGASVTVVSEAAKRETEMNNYKHTTVLRVFGAAGVAENVETLELPRLTLGSTSREKVMAAVLDLDPVNETTGFQQAGIIGGNFLQHYRLTFNFQESLITFEPSINNRTVN